MRKLYLLLFSVCLLGASGVVHAVDWGKITVYAEWEVSTDFGTGDFASHGQTVNVAIGSAKKVEPEYYPPFPPGTTNSLTIYMYPEEKHYTQVSYPVSFDSAKPSAFDADWLMAFSTRSGDAADLTFKCISNQLPNPENLKLRLLTVAGDEIQITAVTEGATQTVSVPSSAEPNSLLATYEVAYDADAEYALTLEPGWNLVGLPFLKITDAGTLFDHPVLRCGAAPVRVSSAAELESGASYWVYNAGSENLSVTITGAARTGGETDFPTLSSGWNYLGVVGVFDETQKAFLPATTIHDYVQWRWIPRSAFFRTDDTAPSVGVGYMVKE